MQTEPLIQLMSRTPDILDALFAGTPDDQARWKKSAASWSMLEVLGHLCDEEKGDFRVRLRLTLDGKGEDWPGINPDEWVKEREHNKKDPVGLLQEFRRERTGSISWLRTLADPPLGNRHTHGSLGPLRAGDLLASWAAHDHRHLEQIHRIRLAWLDGVVKPYSRAYAG